jgi:hypothetical protein
MNQVRTLLIASSILLLWLPIAFLLTLMLLPLWSWVEATTGIESLGHSGPAVWCFLAVYGLSVAGSLAALLLVQRSRRRASRPRSP